jgi:hypothetical protein
MQQRKGRTHMTMWLSCSGCSFMKPHSSSIVPKLPRQRFSDGMYLLSFWDTAIFDRATRSSILSFGRLRPNMSFTPSANCAREERRPRGGGGSAVSGGGGGGAGAASFFEKREPNTWDEGSSTRPNMECRRLGGAAAAAACIAAVEEWLLLVSASQCSAMCSMRWCSVAVRFSVT